MKKYHNKSAKEYNQEYYLSHKKDLNERSRKRYAERREIIRELTSDKAMSLSCVAKLRKIFGFEEED